MTCVCLQCEYCVNDNLLPLQLSLFFHSFDKFVRWIGLALELELDILSSIFYGHQMIMPHLMNRTRWIFSGRRRKKKKDNR